MMNGEERLADHHSEEQSEEERMGEEDRDTQDV